MSGAREFEYLLNAMENASHHSEPAKHFYGDKRKAVFAHVAQLSTELAEALAVIREYVEATDAFVDDLASDATARRHSNAEEAARWLLSKHEKGS